MELERLLEQLKFLESQVAKMDDRIRVSEIYKTINEKLFRVVRLLIISQVIIVLLLVILAKK